MLAHLADHYFWLPRLFWQAGGWRWLVPWPLLLFHKSPSARDHGSIWLTVVCLVAYELGSSRLETVNASLTGDCSRTLFAGAFLVITMLSLSVALPGQTIIKLVLGGDAAFAAEFVSPTLWAFIWGTIGGMGMSLYPYLPTTFRVAASIVALYAIAMEINAVLYTIRMYTIGLVLGAQQNDQSKVP